jgi:hypothetical protein
MAAAHVHYAARHLSGEQEKTFFRSINFDLPLHLPLTRPTGTEMIKLSR